MIILTILISLAGNVIAGNDLSAIVLNSIFLSFYLFFYSKFTGLNFFKLDLNHKNSYLILFIGVLPLFVRQNIPVVVLFTMGLIPLVYMLIRNIENKMLVIFTAIYLFVSGLFVGGLFAFPIKFQNNLLLFNDNWTNLYISQMVSEALYLPYKIRLLMFNSSIYIYVILSRISSLFTLKNFYDIFLIANLYPFVTGLNSVIKSANKSRWAWGIIIFLGCLGLVLSRSIYSGDAFILLSPIIICLILNGFKTVNIKIYSILFLISIFVYLAP